MFGARSWTERGSPPRSNRRAFSIPMVLLFCAMMVIVLVSFVQTRMNMKQQTRITFRQLKAHYLAQSGIQHALLKLRILPLESYDAAAVSRGICPFIPPNATPFAGGAAPNAEKMLAEFITDLGTDTFAAGPAGSAITAYSADFPSWQYRPATVRALMSKTDGDKRTHAIEIVMEGELNENFKGVALTTSDLVTRIVKLTRER